MKWVLKNEGSLPLEFEGEFIAGYSPFREDEDRERFEAAGGSDEPLGTSWMALWRTEGGNFILQRAIFGEPGMSCTTWHCHLNVQNWTETQLMSLARNVPKDIILALFGRTTQRID